MVTHNSSDNLSGKAAISKNAQRCHGPLRQETDSFGYKIKKCMEHLKVSTVPFLRGQAILKTH